MLRVDERDDQQRTQIIDDGDRQQKRAQPAGEPRPDQGQYSQRERGVRRHHRAPAVDR